MPESTDAHDTVQLLLPWFANGSLDDTERTRVAAHLEACAACRRQLEDERRVAAAVRESALPGRSPEPALAGLMATIAAREPAAAKAAAPSPTFWSRWFARPSAAPWPMALAGAGALALVASVGSLAFRAQAPNAYHVLSLTPASKAVDANDIHLVMAPSVDPARRDAILAIVDGRIVDGPNSVGAYTVRIAASGGPVDLTGALDRLRGQPDVLLAEAATPLAMPHLGPDLAP
ncbi:MAG TPA: anti-sigma factor [Nevskiaceae bacterium]|nr:anti-sigma factor [Nevskiaceae bacterium]